MKPFMKTVNSNTIGITRTGKCTGFRKTLTKMALSYFQSNMKTVFISLINNHANSSGMWATSDPSSEYFFKLSPILKNSSLAEVMYNNGYTPRGPCTPFLKGTLVSWNYDQKVFGVTNGSFLAFQDYLNSEMPLQTELSLRVSLLLSLCEKLNRWFCLFI